MALHPNSGPGLPILGYLNNKLLQGWIVRSAPNRQPGAPGLRIYDPGDRVAQLYPQALGTHFSRLLRHAWLTVGLFLNPGHHTGIIVTYLLHIRLIRIQRTRIICIPSSIHVYLPAYICLYLSIHTIDKCSYQHM
jgi:hypothetical protein